MALYPYKNALPSCAPTAWVHPQAFVGGCVSLADNVSVWPNATIRADNEPITIEASSNIQDNACLHTDPGAPCRIGKNVTVGHGAILHGCTVEDGVLIGMGAIILNHALIGKESLIGAGTLIAENKVIAPRSLVFGNPGRVIRELTDDEVAKLALNAQHYVCQAKAWRCAPQQADCGESKINKEI